MSTRISPRSAIALVFALLLSPIAMGQQPVLRDLSCTTATASGTTYACSIASPPSGYVSGTTYRFLADVVNTGAVTINFNSLGAKSVVKMLNGLTTALVANDIRAGQWVDVTYDGTQMQMQNQTSSGNIGVAAGTSLSLGSGSAAGWAQWIAGTAASTPPANTFQIYAPASIATSFSWIPPSAAATGFVLGTNASNNVTLSQVGSTGSGNVVLATSPTITTPSITTINDGNGAAFLKSSATASAIDGLQVTNAATANPATIVLTPFSTGSDANINLQALPLGTGVNIFGNTTTLPTTNTGQALFFNNTKTGISITGKATDASTTTDGVFISMTHNASAARQLLFASTAQAINNTNVGVRFQISDSTAAVIMDGISTDGSTNKGLTVGSTGGQLTLNGGPVVMGGSQLVSTTSSPSITTHFNTSGDSLESGSGSLSGTVIVGTGTATNNGTITFATAFTRAPACFVEDITTNGSFVVRWVTTTTTLQILGFNSTLGSATNFANSDRLTYGCIGH